jgi:hypothetical protein
MVIINSWLLRINIVFISLGFILYYQTASGQEVLKQDFCNVSGTAIDSITNQTIPYCNIILVSKEDSSFYKGAMSDENGRFVIREVEGGDYLLRIVNINYVIKEALIVLVCNENSFNIGDISLFQKDYSITGVEVSGEKILYRFEGEKKIYNCADDQFIQSGTAIDALQNAPGVWVDIEGNVTLRGRADVAIWINGKPSKLKIDMLKLYLRQLPAGALERIEVVTNPSAKYSADGAGGIINIVLKDEVSGGSFYSIGMNYNTKQYFRPWIATLTPFHKVKLYSYFSYSAQSVHEKSGSQMATLQGVDTSFFNRSDYKTNGQIHHFYGYIDLEYKISKKSTFDGWNV